MKHNSRVRAEQLLTNALDRANNSNAPPADVTNATFNGKVINIDDPLKSRRVQVRVPAIDGDNPNKEPYVADRDLAWCYTMLPPYLWMMPAVGEHVIVFLQNPWVRRSGRYYIASLMSGDEVNQTYDESMKKLDLIKSLDQGKR